MHQENYVPIKIKLRFLIHNPMFIFGIVFGGVGLLFSSIFGLSTDFYSIAFKNKDTEIVTGAIKSYSATNSSENDQKIYKFYYDYKVDGHSMEGVSYTTSPGIYWNDDFAEVEFIESNPEISRIVGMRSKPFSLWTSFVFLFPLIGLTILFKVILEGIKTIRILKYGKLATAKFSTMESTNTKINNRTIMKVYFEFKDMQGQPHEGYAKTHIPELITDDTEEKIVYNTRKPEEILLLDSVNRHVRAFIEQNIH